MARESTCCENYFLVICDLVDYVMLWTVLRSRNKHLVVEHLGGHYSRILEHRDPINWLCFMLAQTCGDECHLSLTLKG